MEGSRRPSKSESAGSAAFPSQPSQVLSGTQAGSADGKGAGKGDVNVGAGSPVVCRTCGSEGKRFKMESVWEWDDQEAEEGHWLHTCVLCLVDREGLPSLQAALAWISESSRAVSFVSA